MGAGGEESEGEGATLADEKHSQQRRRREDTTKTGDGLVMLGFSLSFPHAHNGHVRGNAHTDTQAHVQQHSPVWTI